MTTLRDFVAELVTANQGVVEPSEHGDVLEVLAPADVQQALGVAEHVRLSFGAAHQSDRGPVPTQRVGLESEWLDRFALLLGNRGSYARVVRPAPSGSRPRLEGVLEKAVQLDNAALRLDSIEPAWSRYTIATFRYTAVSDDKRDGVLRVGINQSNGALLDGFVDRLAESALYETRGEFTQAATGNLPGSSVSERTPTAWDPDRLWRVLRPAARARVQARLGHFLASMQRRQQRDMARIQQYHQDLGREVQADIDSLGDLSTRSDKQQAQFDRAQKRKEAIERELHAKTEDLRRKFAMSIDVDCIQLQDVVCPTQRLWGRVLRRKKQRQFCLDYNLAVRRVDELPCEATYEPGGARVVCDDALHFLSRAALGPCDVCTKEYCRACHRAGCPKCRKGQS